VVARPGIEIRHDLETGDHSSVCMGQ
jgi:hypothetical protein